MAMTSEDTSTTNPRESLKDVSSDPEVSTEVAAWIDKQDPVSNESVDISIVIPAYNEQWRLPSALIDTIDYMDAEKKNYEIIIVDDGSHDDTCAVIKKFEKIRSQVKLITLPENKGKGHAVRFGMLNSKGKKVLFADADGSTPISEIERLEKAIQNGADVAFGSRALLSENTSVKTVWYRKFIGRLFNWFVTTLVLPGVKDTQCGFKMFSRKAADFIFTRQTFDGFNFDVELLFIARQAGFNVQEVSVNWTNVPGSKVNLIKDSLKMLYGLFLIRVRHRNIEKPG
jgi:dolichyl-phosphate beta-glucosyltransferase